jgi:hypothetical protein
MLESELMGSCDGCRTSMCGTHALSVGNRVGSLSVTCGRSVGHLRWEHGVGHAGLLLLLLVQWLLHHARVHELTDVVELVVLPCIRDCLAERTAHSDVVGEVCSKAAIEVGVLSLQVCSQTTILHGEVVIFLLVHLLVDNILLSDTKRAASATLVDLRRATC